MTAVAWRLTQGTELSQRIDECCHRWQRRPDGTVRCTVRKGCNATLSGALAADPPRRGMDWSQAVLVGPMENKDKR